MIGKRLQEVRHRIKDACKRAGRNPGEIELVLVTKQVEPDRVQEAYDAGCRDFGENRVQEFLEKRARLPKVNRWHFVGSLQTNKVKSVVGEVVLIHSLDRVDLARALQKEAEKKDQTVDVLIQVNTSGEETKHGVQPQDLQKVVREAVHFDRLRVRGLMTIGPFTEDQERIRASFRLLCRLRDQMQNDFSNVDWHYLSMGMSSDFEIAIEEGSNCLRIGTAVFGARS